MEQVRTGVATPASTLVRLRPRLQPRRLPGAGLSVVLACLALLVALSPVASFPDAAAKGKGKRKPPAIAFARFPGNGNETKIFVMPASGETTRKDGKKHTHGKHHNKKHKHEKKQKPVKARQISSGPGNDRNPRWAPGGARLLFVRDTNGQQDIWTVAANGKGQQNLTASPETESAAAWSPDGSRIAFIRPGAIWVMNADGSGQTLVSDTLAAISSIDWSPDGSLLAYEGLGAGGYIQIWTVEPDGDNPLQLTAEDLNHFTPRWSPDSSSIVFSHNSDIIRINRDGTNRRQLTSGGNVETSPTWSPDGKRIMFARGARFFTVAATGGKTKSVPTRTVSFEPDWRR